MTHIVIIIAWNFSLMDQTRPGSLKFSQMSEYLPELCKFPHNNRHFCTVNKLSTNVYTECNVYTLCTHYTIRGNLSNRPHQHNLTRTVTGFFLIIISIPRNESNRQFCISFFTQPQIRRWEASCNLDSADNRGDRHTDFSGVIKIKIP